MNVFRFSVYWLIVPWHDAKAPSVVLQQVPPTTGAAHTSITPPRFIYLFIFFRFGVFLRYLMT